MNRETHGNNRASIDMHTGPDSDWESFDEKRGWEGEIETAERAARTIFNSINSKDQFLIARAGKFNALGNMPSPELCADVVAFHSYAPAVFASLVKNFGKFAKEQDESGGK